MLASENGHLEVARLLCEAGADNDKEDAHNETALMLASSRPAGRQDVALEVVRLLCEAGADKDKPGRTGWTSLMWASYGGHLETARLLSEAGADRDKRKRDGFTALILASENGHLEVAQLLREQALYGRAGARTAMYITRCAARGTFGNQAGHNAPSRHTLGMIPPRCAR